MNDKVKLIHKVTGNKKELVFSHAEAFLQIDNSYVCAKDSGYIFDGKDLVKQPKKKKKTENPEGDK